MPLVGGAMVAIVALGGMWWWRVRRVEPQRQSLRVLFTLSEDLIASADPTEIAEKLSNMLPAVSRATAVNLYLYNRRTKSLERVPTAADPEPMAASIEDPPDGLANAAAVCFRNRTLLSVPDVRRNPLIKIGPKMSLPKSAMFVPIAGKSESAGQEVLGILEIHNGNKVGYFPPEEQAAAQHLANQVAASLKLQEQQNIREQLFRSEKLAATGQLISGVANELQTPLDCITGLASSLEAHEDQPIPRADLSRLAAEARRASEIVARLVSFSGKEDARPKQVDANHLVASLVRFREPEWRALELRVQNRLSPEPAFVTAAQAQLEQVFLNLLVHAEQRSGESESKTLGIHSSVIANRVVVEISYATPAQSRGRETEANPLLDPKTGASLASEAGMGLTVCQSIVHGHGGEIRFFSWMGAARFEVELPLNEERAEEAEPAPVGAGRVLTLMLVEPDPVAQRQLLAAIGARGHRVVPVSPDEAAELVHRLRFDAVMWAVRSAGPRWGDFRERAGAAAPAFVLISDGYDHELARSLEESGGFLLSRPVQEQQLDRVLAGVIARE
jgi:nitrogen-specific signal transduction histidine kinase